jgi:hypothetical protein
MESLEAEIKRLKIENSFLKDALQTILHECVQVFATDVDKMDQDATNKSDLAALDGE